MHLWIGGGGAQDITGGPPHGAGGQGEQQEAGKQPILHFLLNEQFTWKFWKMTKLMKI